MTAQTLAAASAPSSVSPAPLELVQPLLQQLAFHHFALHQNVDGITQEESVRQPQPGGNCLNWVLGHIVFGRQVWLTRVLGQPPLADEPTIAIYRRGSDPLTDGSLALPFDELLRLYDAAQQPLLSAIAALTAERLAEKAPFSPRGNPDETIGTLVASLVFHEGYHIGQTAILRRLVGRSGAIA